MHASSSGSGSHYICNYGSSQKTPPIDFDCYYSSDGFCQDPTSVASSSGYTSGFSDNTSALHSGSFHFRALDPLQHPQNFGAVDHSTGSQSASVSPHGTPDSHPMHRYPGGPHFLYYANHHENLPQLHTLPLQQYPIKDQHLLKPPSIMDAGQLGRVLCSCAQFYFIFLRDFIFKKTLFEKLLKIVIDFKIVIVI